MNDRLKNIIFRFIDNLFGEYEKHISSKTGRIYLVKEKNAFAQIDVKRQTFNILESHFYLVKNVFSLETQEEVSDLFCEWLKIKEDYSVQKTWQSLSG